jgi:adenylate cyclase
MSTVRPASVSEPWLYTRTIERAAKLWSGVILMVFVSTHLLNHALGIFGVDVMGIGQEWRVMVWRSWPGTILLYGALAVHVALAMRRAVNRRTWRMPPLEALQIVLGILIPVLLLGHVVGTHVMSSLAGFDDSYVNVLKALWPVHAAMQSAALVVVWCHGIIGLHAAFHVRRWYAPLKMPLSILAVMIPVLALAGFVAAGREATGLAATQAPRTLEQLDIQARAMATGNRLTATMTIRYTGHGEVKASPGMTLLEVSRANNIPHPSACGGRGRCSSCRVVVVEGQDGLDPPNRIEQNMLERIRASQHVRLACQIRPRTGLSVRILLETQTMPAESGTLSGHLDWGVEEDLTVLFADMRGFSSLANNQLPVDVVTLLNRVIGEMTQAVEARGGIVTQVQTDGIMAVFGMNQKSRTGSRAAVNAAADLLKAIQLVNKDLSTLLPIPVRVGIGIHTGQVIVAEPFDHSGGQRVVVIGEAVVVASRLEEITKEFAADCVISTRTLEAAGLSPTTSEERRVNYKNGAKPVRVHVFGGRQELRTLLRRAATKIDPQPAAVVN